MKLTFLGTNAGKPILNRNVSSMALNLNPVLNEIWLFDCGEGTQQQMFRFSNQQTDKKERLYPNRIDKVFITHLHGDHVFGLVGLLTSRSMENDAKNMTIIGPVGIKKLIEVSLEITQSYLTFEVEFIELTELPQGSRPHPIFEHAGIKVSTLSLDHRVPSFAYRLEMTENNESKIIVIYGDTYPCENQNIIAKEADVLVHEATFEAKLLDKAILRKHSTTTQVAQLAEASKVKRLIITHISLRYHVNAETILLNECKQIFPNTDLAHDLESFTL